MKITKLAFILTSKMAKIAMLIGITTQIGASYANAINLMVKCYAGKMDEFKAKLQ
jgi:hypothetical protein